MLKALEEARSKAKAKGTTMIARIPSVADALETRAAALMGEEGGAQMLPEHERWAYSEEALAMLPKGYREETAQQFRRAVQALHAVSKYVAAQSRAESLFGEIADEIGIDRAREIFSELAKPPTKQKIEEAKNVELLELYIQMKWPVQRLARFLAEANKRFPRRFGTRSGTWEAIEKQLWRLIKTAPSEVKPGRMTGLIKEAAKVHQEIEIKPGRPRSDK
jgi:hypothetical protein